MKNELKKILTKVKNGLGGEDVTFKIDHSVDLKRGHYAANLALVLAKKKSKNPRELAETIIEKLKKDSNFNNLFKAEVAGPGFINFWIKKEALQKSLANILAAGPSYGLSDQEKGCRFLVEYGQPNPFKALHIGHLRNLILGEAVARLLENVGGEVKRVNYQGDIGLHVAKCFWRMQKEKPSVLDLSSVEKKVAYLSQCYVVGAKAYEENEEAKEEINRINKELYSMEGELKKEWQEKREWSLEGFRDIFKRMGVSFDHSYFESEMAKDGLLKCQEALEKGILIEDDGCLVFPGERHGLNRRVFRNKIGLPTYEGKELGLAFCEFTDFSPIKKAIHVVASEQVNFFEVTFLVERLLDEKLFCNKQVHLSYGFVSLKEGKMSSRLGKVVLGQAIIDAAKKEVLALLEKRKNTDLTEVEKEKIAEKVAIGAVKYSFLKISSRKNIVFSLKESVRMDGQSGPYLMYSYVRASNILKQLALKKEDLEGNVKIIAEKEEKIKEENEANLLREEESLLVIFLKFPEILERALRDYEPAFLAEYAYDLANAFSLFYDKVPVLKEADSKKRAFRINLVRAFLNIEGRVLDLLGIEKLTKM
jgi:arginyl-tRNA synthetase